jgi:hypothetical protein
MGTDPYTPNKAWLGGYSVLTPYHFIQAIQPYLYEGL